MDNYVANVIPHLKIWWSTIIILAYLVGVAFAIISAMLAVSHKRKFDRSAAVWTLFAAVFLLNLPAFMDSLSQSIFLKTSEQALSYSPPSSPASVYIQFAVYAIMTVGVIGIIRGLCLMRDTSNQSQNFSRAVVHIFGGIFAVNIVTFLQGIGASIGGDVQSYVGKILG